MTPVIVLCKSPMPNRIYRLWNTFSAKHYKVKLVRNPNQPYQIETEKYIIPLSKVFINTLFSIRTINDLYYAFDRYGFGELEDIKDQDIIKCVEKYVSIRTTDFMKTIPQVDLCILAKVRSIVDMLRVFANKQIVPSRNIFFYPVHNSGDKNHLTGATFEQAYYQLNKHMSVHAENIPMYMIHLDLDEDFLLNARIVLSGDIIFGKYDCNGMFPIIFKIGFDNLYQEKYYRKVIYCDEKDLLTATKVFFDIVMKKKRKTNPDDIQILVSSSKIRSLQAIMSVAGNDETMNILNESYVKDIFEEDNIVIL